MYISIYGLAYFLIFCIFTVVAVFLIIALYNINSLVKRANKVLESNSDNINKTLTVLPEAIKNVNEVSLSVKDNLNRAGAVIGTLEEAVTETVVTVSESAESIFDFIKIFGNVFNAVMKKFKS